MAPTLIGTRSAAVAQPRPVTRPLTRAFALPEVRWAAVSTALFLMGAVAQFTAGAAWLWWALYLACYLTGGWEPAWAGLRALRQKSLDVDLLMIVAAIGAAAIGQILEGGLLIVIFATSGALEALATQRTADSVKALLGLAPEQATRLLPDGGEERVETAGLAVGDVLMVRPGERISADGEVLDGSSDVDQASITGEPLPVAKAVGDEVFAGTQNGAGALRVRVDRAASDTVVARIVALVEKASATKATTQLFIEKIEQRYSVGVVVATLALFFVPLAIGSELQSTLLRAMTFMIVASPCAVVLATMPPLLSAIANAGRHGVLVKSAVVMERLGDTTTVAFDKTGTLTEGTPEVVDIRVPTTSACNEREVLRLAAATEHPSEHPLGRAVVTAAHDRDLRLPPVTEFSSTPGRGVSAIVDGYHVSVVSPAHLRSGDRQDQEPGDTVAQTAVIIAELEAIGRTAVVVVVDGVPAGVLGLADQLRPVAARTVTELTVLTGSTPVLLTGDNHRAATHLAGKIGITDVRAALLPEGKVTAVRDLEARGAAVLVVGDGVNDAPALAAAHVGVAMGRAGSDLALDTADAVLVRDELGAVPAVIALSRRARRLVIANLIIAATSITGLVLWDLCATLPLPLGVAGHEGSTVIVGLNGLRLLRESAWRISPPSRGSGPDQRG